MMRTRQLRTWRIDSIHKENRFLLLYFASSVISAEIHKESKKEPKRISLSYAHLTFTHKHKQILNINIINTLGECKYLRTTERIKY